MFSRMGPFWGYFGATLTPRSTKIDIAKHPLNLPPRFFAAYHALHFHVTINFNNHLVT
jgi:hypothetical protein